MTDIRIRKLQRRVASGKLALLQTRNRLRRRIDPDVLEASICRDSFYQFVKRFWEIVVPEEMIDNWHIRYLCDQLQEVAERVFRGEAKEYDLLINVPPGTTKSTICSVMFPVWVWTRMSSARTICASYAYSLALDLSRKSRMIVRSDKWQRLFGIELSEDQDTKGYFVNEFGGSRYSVGTGGGVMGLHAHFIIVDDPLNPKEAASEAELKAAIDFQFETLPTRKVDKAVSVMITIMQRLHQADPSGELLERQENQGLRLRHINLPGEIDGNNQKDVKPPELVVYYEDGLLDRKRLSRQVLAQLFIELGEYGYAGQILQRPVPRGGGMFKVERIHVEPSAPLTWTRKNRVRYWDKAGTKGKADGGTGRGAWTVGALLGKDRENKYWILDIVRGQWESAKREAIILQTAQMDGKGIVVGVEQEPGSSGKEAAEATARNLAGFRVRIDRVTGEKEVRADPFSTQVNAGNVYMVRASWNKELLNELEHFPFSRYKDQVDACSGAFNLLTKARTKVGALR